MCFRGVKMFQSTSNNLLSTMFLTSTCMILLRYGLKQSSHLMIRAWLTRESTKFEVIWHWTWITHWLLSSKTPSQEWRILRRLTGITTQRARIQCLTISQFCGFQPVVNVTSQPKFLTILPFVYVICPILHGIWTILAKLFWTIVCLSKHLSNFSIRPIFNSHFQRNFR